MGEGIQEEVAKVRDPSELYRPWMLYRGEERVTGLQATGSRFGILGDDVVTEDEGMVSTEEGVCTGSGVVKDIASTNDTNVTLGAKHSSPLRRAGGIGKACTAP
ncbi:hypothetical protein V6N11_001539 [Hibiscus sabdariffa]|uniref:Uncharacterized protein n=1 Tax=Hibiscus sabdariffa TaxID=183260 RepID=A0ABR2S018_9ROSI